MRSSTSQGNPCRCVGLEQARGLPAAGEKFMSILVCFALSGGSLAFDPSTSRWFVRSTTALPNRGNLDVQRRIRVEIDFGPLVSEIAPRTILARVQVRSRRQLRIAVLLGSPRSAIGRGRRLKPGNAEVAFLLGACSNGQDVFEVGGIHL